MMRKPLKPLKPSAVLKSIGPKLVPFFKTVTIFFVLYPEVARMDSIVFAAFKVLPIASLMIFVLLHGMNFTEVYSYSRKILIGLMFSAVGDIFLAFDGYFIPGVGAFAVAQFIYAWAFGLRPPRFGVGAICGALGALIYSVVYQGLSGVMVYVVAMYTLLIVSMAWRATARVQIFDDLWTWTKLASCAGAITFVISDTTIAYDKFVSPIPYAHTLIMSTYYAAQMMITCSVVDSQADAMLHDS